MSVSDDDSDPVPHDHKWYTFRLPVLKQGDDFEWAVGHTESLKDALLLQADHYATAVELCRKMAGVVAECPEIEMSGCTHSISITGPEDRLDELVRQELIDVESMECDDSDCEDNEYEDDEDNETE